MSTWLFYGLKYAQNPFSGHPAGGAYDAPPDALVGWGEGPSIPRPLPFGVSTCFWRSSLKFLSPPLTLLYVIFSNGYLRIKFSAKNTPLHSSIQQHRRTEFLMLS